MYVARQCSVHDLTESFHPTLKRKSLCENTYTNIVRSTKCYDNLADNIAYHASSYRGSCITNHSDQNLW